MGFFKKLIDLLTLGSDHPIRRLVGYYVVLTALIVGLAYFFPFIDRMFGAAGPTELVRMPQVLQDGLGNPTALTGEPSQVPGRLTLVVGTLVLIFTALALVLPVSWVYMSTRTTKVHNQQVAQTLIFLPLVVAGVVLVVQNSLALAFSLAGVVAAVRFRTTLRDVRDVVFIFLVIVVGFAVGVQSLIVAAIVSLSFNFIMILTWRYDFGRNVLEPTASSQWAGALTELAHQGTNGRVPDRDLVMALDQKKVLSLAERFDRVRKIMGPSGKKQRYNAILMITTERLPEAQERVGQALDEHVGRWRLDEVVTNTDKPSQLYYLVQVRKRASRDEVLTGIRSVTGKAILTADLEIGLARAKEDEEAVEKDEEKDS
jgi:hypothetical protein